MSLFVTNMEAKKDIQQAIAQEKHEFIPMTLLFRLARHLHNRNTRRQKNSKKGG
jgi:hypothetical protein